MKSARLILLLLFSSFSFVLSSAQNVNERVKTSKITILGMGDSITEGGGDSFTYLLPLWEKLCKMDMKLNLWVLNIKNIPK